MLAHFRWNTRLLFLLGLTCSLLAGCKQQPVADAGEEAYADALQYNVPEKFEPYLRQHPDNEAVRENAIRYYAYRSQDFERLRFHTLQMVKHHPSNFLLTTRNSTAFYIHPEYRREVIAALEKQLSIRPQITSQHYFNIAYLYEREATPPPNEPEARKRFYSYYQLPATTKLPITKNQALIDKAIRYYYKAVETARKNKSNSYDLFYIGFSAQQLANLLLRERRSAEAIRVCEEALPEAEKVSKPDLLLTYGRCLKKVGQTDKAEVAFKQIRKIDDEWSEGPGRTTMQAETELGLLALDTGDMKRATQYLLSSLNVKTHNTRGANGLPINFPLAQKLLEAGQYETVIQYCRRMSSKFGKCGKELDELLQKATQAQDKAKT